MDARDATAVEEAPAGMPEFVALPALPAIPGLHARLFEPARDYPAVAELVATTNARDGVEWIPTAASLEHGWSAKPFMDPARDVVLAEIGGRLVGMTAVDARHRVDRIVHRIEVTVRHEERRKGIGSALLRWAELHAREKIREGRGWPESIGHALGLFVDADVDGAQEFAAKHGYRAIRFSYTMHRDLTMPIPVLPLPEGLDVRPVVEADHRKIWDADIEAFLDHFEPTEVTEDDFVAFFTHPDHATSLWQVAWDGDEVAGSVMTNVYPSENEKLGVRRGWLDSVAVRRPWRKRGIASALIARSLVALREHGMTEAALGVDAENPTGALAIYERLGFVRHRTAATYRKEP